MSLHPTSAKAIRANIERMTLYLGYGATGTERKAFLDAAAKELGLPSISALIHKLIVEKYPNFPKTGV